MKGTVLIAPDRLHPSWIGYAIANMWCYALGVMVISVSAPDANLVNTLLLAQAGLLALGLILLDELDNAYGDVYSASVNSHSLLAQWSIRQWGLAIAVMCSVLALFLPMHSIEPFLLTLSSVFVPLYGVILGRLGTGQPSFALTQRKLDPTAATAAKEKLVAIMKSFSVSRILRSSMLATSL